MLNLRTYINTILEDDDIKQAILKEQKGSLNVDVEFKNCSFD